MSDGASGGVATLLARAARDAARAQVAIVPLRAVEQGLSKGDIRISDVCACTADAELCTVTLPSAFLRLALEKDCAGAGLLVTTGAEAVLGDPETMARISMLESESSSSGTLTGTRGTTGTRETKHFACVRRSFCIVRAGWNGKGCLSGRLARLLERSDEWLFSGRESRRRRKCRNDGSSKVGTPSLFFHPARGACAVPSPKLSDPVAEVRYPPAAAQEGRTREMVGSKQQGATDVYRSLAEDSWLADD